MEANPQVELDPSRYRLLEKLGEGGMASIYRLHDVRAREDCALKVMAPEYASSQKLRRRFIQEARLMADLVHPNIVTVREIADEAHTPSFVMELLDGSLAHVIEQTGPVSAQVAVWTVIQVLQGLAYAHSKNIVHRDIKPDNILLTADGLPKLTDFGIAMAGNSTRHTMTGAVMGTLAYMPPEQRVDASKVDHRADVYAVGATLAYLVLGDNPVELQFPKWSRADLFPECPDAVVECIARSTHFDRKERYATAQEMIEALEAYAQTAPPIAHGLTAPQVLKARTARAKLTNPPNDEVVDAPSKTWSPGPESHSSSLTFPSAETLPPAAIRALSTPSAPVRSKRLPWIVGVLALSVSSLGLAAVVGTAVALVALQPEYATPDPIPDTPATETPPDVEAEAQAEAQLRTEAQAEAGAASTAEEAENTGSADPPSKNAPRPEAQSTPPIEPQAEPGGSLGTLRIGVLSDPDITVYLWIDGENKGSLRSVTSQQLLQSAHGITTKLTGGSHTVKLTPTVGVETRPLPVEIQADSLTNLCYSFASNGECSSGDKATLRRIRNQATLRSP